MKNPTFSGYQDVAERILRYYITHGAWPAYGMVEGEKINREDYIDAVKRVQAFIDKEKKNPPNVRMGKEQQVTPQPQQPLTNTCPDEDLRPGCKGENVKAVQNFLNDRGFATNTDGIYTDQTKGAVAAFQTAAQSIDLYQGYVVDGLYGHYTAVAAYWYDSKKAGRTPAPTPSQPSANGVYSSPAWRHYQDQETGYWCGPFTDSQIIYELWGHEAAQSYLASLGGTTSAGTDHDGLLYAINTWASRNGHSCNSWFQNFSSTGWDQLGQWVADPNIGIGIHCLYKDRWGHYMYVVQVNMNNQTVICIDSLNEEDTIAVDFGTFARWIAETPGGQPSVLVVKKNS
jgi:peptidoglycan hydrolase-like protein with peptidoglycan-binding domain